MFENTLMETQFTVGQESNKNFRYFKLLATKLVKYRNYMNKLKEKKENFVYFYFFFTDKTE